MPALQNTVTCWRCRNINAWPEFSAERQSRECWGRGGAPDSRAWLASGQNPLPAQPQGQVLGGPRRHRWGVGRQRLLCGPRPGAQHICLGHCPPDPSGFTHQQCFLCVGQPLSEHHGAWLAAYLKHPFHSSWYKSQLFIIFH